jgi:hypothetical protein
MAVTGKNPAGKGAKNPVSGWKGHKNGDSEKNFPTLRWMIN